MLAGRVDHQVEMIAAVGDHEVVFEAALVVGEKPVTLAAGFQAGDVDRGDLFKRQRGIAHVAAFGADQDLPHVRDIEQPGLLAGVKVFLHHAHRVLDRHVVAGKARHACAELKMQGMKRGL